MKYANKINGIKKNMIARLRLIILFRQPLKGDHYKISPEKA